MIKNCLVSLLLFVNFVVCGQSEVKEDIILTLDKEDILMTNESRFVVSCNEDQMCLVIKNKNNSFSVFKNGKQSGPFENIFEANNQCMGMIGEYDKSSLFEPKPMDFNNSYVVVDENAKYRIKFAGKEFGPYHLIINMFVSDDKQNFFALAMGLDNIWRIVSKSSEVVLAEVPSVLKMSPTGKSCIAITSTGLDLVSEMTKLSELKLPEEEYNKRLSQLMEKAMSSTNVPQNLIYTSDGKKFGPYSSEKLSVDKIAYSKTGGDHWMMIMDQCLFIDGIKATCFENDWVSISDVWISSDGTNYAYKTYDKLVFKDKSFNFPLSVEYCCQNNACYLMWISLENNINLKKYRRKF